MKPKWNQCLAIALIAASVDGVGSMTPQSVEIVTKKSNIQGEPKTYFRPASLETAIALPGLFEQIRIILGLDPEKPVIEHLTLA